MAEASVGSPLAGEWGLAASIPSLATVLPKSKSQLPFRCRRGAFDAVANAHDRVIASRDGGGPQAFGEGTLVFLGQSTFRPMLTPLTPVPASTRLGTTIHAYSAIAQLPHATVFQCFAPYARVFDNGPLAVLSHPERTTWPGDFRHPRHGEHVRDSMAGAMGAIGAPSIVLAGVGQRRLARVALCPHAAERFKEWPVHRWQALAEHLLHQGFEVMAFPQPQRERWAWPDGVFECLVDLPRLAGALQMATFAVAVDSGPGHLADLFGTPVVGLYAATSAITYGPYGSRHLCVDRHEDAFPIGRRYDTAAHVTGNPMYAVTVNTVLRTIGENFSPPP